jgi:hypothetical protein
MHGTSSTILTILVFATAWLLSLFMRPIRKSGVSISVWLLVPDSRLLPYECNEPAWEDHLEDLRRAAGNR